MTVTAGAWEAAHDCKRDIHKYDIIEQSNSVAYSALSYRQHSLHSPPPTQSTTYTAHHLHGPAPTQPNTYTTQHSPPPTQPTTNTAHHLHSPPLS